MWRAVSSRCLFVSLAVKSYREGNPMTKARVLVVLPTLGQRHELLEQALESIRAQGDLVRCVVVAPQRASAVKKLATAYGAEWVPDPATGIAAAVNAGIAAREGEEFYAWLGDDDLFRSHGLATLVRLLDTNPDATLAFGGCDYILDDGRTLAVSRAGALATWLLPWGPDLIPHPGTVIRLDDLVAIGGFDESLKFTLDLDAFLRLRARGSFVHTTEVVSAFRWHPDSLTVSDRRGSSREAMAVKTRHLPRLLQPLSGLWNYPVWWASEVAAWLLVRRARALLRK
jgi:GT2 family glycosyltransferase